MVWASEFCGFNCRLFFGKHQREWQSFYFLCWEIAASPFQLLRLVAVACEWESTQGGFEQKTEMNSDDKVEWEWQEQTFLAVVYLWVCWARSGAEHLGQGIILVHTPLQSLEVPFGDRRGCPPTAWIPACRADRESAAWNRGRTWRKVYCSCWTVIKIFLT